MNNTFLHIIKLKRTVLLFVVFCLCFMQVIAQEKVDTLSVKALNDQTMLLIAQESYLEAEKSAIEATRKADIINYPLGKAIASANLAKVFKHNKQYKEGLKYGIQALDLFKSLGKQKELSDVYDQVAYLYENMEEYDKAIEYFQASLALKKQLGFQKQGLIVQEHIAVCQEVVRDINDAIRNYEELLSIYKTQGQTPDKVEDLLLKLSSLAEFQDDWVKAKSYNTDLLQLYLQKQNYKEIVVGLNNLGVLEKKNKNVKEADAYFKQAEALADSIGRTTLLDDETQIALLVNSSVIATNLNAYAKSRKLLSDALIIAIDKRKPVYEANIYNHLAGNYYLSDVYTLAKENVEKAERIAKSEEDAEDVLEESYYLKYLLGMKKNDVEEAEKYKKLYEAIKGERKVKFDEARKQLLSDKVEADKQEASIRSLIASQEGQARNLRQLTIDGERRKQSLEIKEKELALLKTEGELQKTALLNQQLEKDRIQQRLALAEEEARNAEQRQKIALLQKDKELQELAKKEKEQELELAKAKSILDAETIKQQEQFAFGMGLILLLFALLGIVLAIGYIQKRKDNKKIKKQNELIEEKNIVLTTQSEEIAIQNRKLTEQANSISTQNEELRQQSEEIMAQRDLNILQKDKLEESNTQIKNSIYAAEMIQTAILPTHTELSKSFTDYFVVYLPKDIVSGDFYWFYKTEEYDFVVIADCTGHGVPGAFTCMIGHSQLNEIIGIQKLYEPNEILERLHHNINTMLKQEDEDIHTGMDLALIRIKKTSNGSEIKFSGAKRSLYYISKGSEKLEELSGDRRSIGGAKPKKKALKPFTNKEAFLSEGSVFYAFSDGYTDQHNANGRKIGTKSLIELLENVASKPLPTQGKSLENILNNHMEGVQQRDDILVAGFKV